MNEVDEEVILLEHPVVFVEPDASIDDDVGHEDVTTEYVLAQVDNDYDEVIVEEAEELVLVEEIVLPDVEHLDASDDGAWELDDPTLQLKVA